MKLAQYLAITATIFCTTVAPQLSLANSAATVNFTPNSSLIADNTTVPDRLGEDFRDRMESKGYEFIGTGEAGIRGLKVNNGKKGIPKVFVLEKGYQYVFSSANGGSDTHEIAIVQKSNGKTLIGNIEGERTLKRSNGSILGEIDYGFNRLDENTFLCNIYMSFNTTQTVYIIPKGKNPGKIKWMLLRISLKELQR
jgi:hypothetical protein